MPEYIVHPEPVGRNRANFIAMVNLEPFGFPGAQEQVWLREADGGMQLCCIPFRAYGISLNDILTVDQESGTVLGLIKSSGHQTFRIFLPGTLAEEEFSQLTETISQRIELEGLLAEWSGDRHVAIDLPPGREITQVWAEIEPSAAEEKIFWEWSDVIPFSPD